MVTPLQFTFLEYTVPGVIVHILHLVGYFWQIAAYTKLSTMPNVNDINV